MNIEEFEKMLKDPTKPKSELFRYIVFGNYDVVGDPPRRAFSPEGMSIESHADFLRSEDVCELVKKYRPDFIETFEGFREGFLNRPIKN